RNNRGIAATSFQLVGMGGKLENLPHESYYGRCLARRVREALASCVMRNSAVPFASSVKICLASELPIVSSTSIARKACNWRGERIALVLRCKMLSNRRRTSVEACEG